MGAVAEGGSVNFRDIRSTPTATARTRNALGHITPVVHPCGPVVSQPTPTFLVNSSPCTLQRRDDDLVVDRRRMPGGQRPLPKALVVRTLPNDDAKATRLVQHQSALLHR